MGILGTKTGSRKKERAPKPDELLSSVVHETAAPAAFELLRMNPLFTFPSGSSHVILLVKTESIGGLSKSQDKDEAKGQLIQQIGSDLIHVIATAPMLTDSIFGIIPDAQSLTAMSEFSLLTDVAELAWGVVYITPDTGAMAVEMVHPATFTQARMVSAGAQTLQEVVGERAWAEHSGLAPAPQSLEDQVFGVLQDGYANPATEQVPVYQADPGDPLFDQIADGDPSAASAYSAVSSVSAEEPVYDSAPSAVSAEEPVFASADEVYDEQPAFEEDVEVAFHVDDEIDGDEEEGEVEEDDEELLLEDETAAEAVLARRFLSDDLDLQVRLDEFDATFSTGAPVVQIGVPEGATQWLGDQIAHLSRQANAEIAQLHDTHQRSLRTLYVDLMSKHIEQIIRDVDITTEGSRYKALADELDDGARKRRDNKDDEIRSRKNKVREDFEAQAEEVGKQAALQAALQFKERNRSRMEREQNEIAVEVDRIIEDQYTQATQSVLRVRKRDAQLKLQVGQTKIFSALAQKRDQLLDAEAELLSSWKSQIAELIEDNRKADIAHIETLREHQREADEIGDLRKEQEAQLAKIRAEHAERVRVLEASLKRAEEETSSKVAESETEWKRKFELEKSVTDSQGQRITNLLGQIAEAEQKTATRYEGQVADAESERNVLVTEVERLARQQQIGGIICILLILVAAGIGLTAGVFGALLLS